MRLYASSVAQSSRPTISDDFQRACSSPGDCLIEQISSSIFPAEAIEFGDIVAGICLDVDKRHDDRQASRAAAGVNDVEMPHPQPEAAAAAESTGRR